MSKIDAQDGIVHFGSVLGACGQQLTKHNRTGLAREATCEECRMALGIVGGFLNTATKSKRKRKL